MKICMIGEGAQAETHMKALAEIDGVEVVSVAGGIRRDLDEFADRWEIPHRSLDLDACLSQPDVEAVINTGPSQLHAEQTRRCLARRKHVLLEIPMALNLADSEALADGERESGLTCMVCHTRHYGAALRELKRRIDASELHLHHIVCQTYFFRRVNINRFGQPRTWKDDLLWHHACHAVDMSRWLLGDNAMRVWGQVGPDHPELGIPMDLSVALRSDSTGAIVTIAHSFNNHGEIQTPMRFIGEEATYLLVDNRLTDHTGKVVAEGTAHEGVVRQDCEFIAAIREGRAPETSFADSLHSMRYIDRIQQTIDAARRGAAMGS